MRTLIINTYAGSLLVGADAIEGSRIIGSYEDCGFGAENTKANRDKFKNLEPGFTFVDHIKQWPDQDLSDVIVLAHPPCAAFSQQNTSKAKRGINTDAFQCTVKVLKYAMTNNAAAIAVESVPGALSGAWDIYDAMSNSGGYHVYRIMKNSLLFGVPQFRERFWAVLVRKDLAGPSMTWRLSPKIRTVSSVLDPLVGGTPIPSLHKAINKFVKQLTTGPCICGKFHLCKQCSENAGHENHTGTTAHPFDAADPQVVHGFDEAEVRACLNAIPGYKRSGFSAQVQKKFFPNLDKGVVCRRHVSPFTSGQPSILAPGGYSPVLLGSSVWVYNGQPVTEEGYKAIMGFPVDYVFPTDKNYSMRTYLSKGVCPPVATWILDNIRMHLGLPSGSDFTKGVGYEKVIEHGHIGSFRPGRNQILERLEGLDKVGAIEDDELIDLRNEEEALEED